MGQNFKIRATKLAGVQGEKLANRPAADGDLLLPQAVDLPLQLLLADVKNLRQFLIRGRVLPAQAVSSQMFFQLFACHFSSFLLNVLLILLGLFLLYIENF